MEDATFTEVYAIVKYKLANGLPMNGAKETLMAKFLIEWTSAFGYYQKESLK